MNQPSRLTGHTARTPDRDVNEAHRRTVATPTIHPRRLIAAGVKRGTGRLVVQAVAA